MQRNVIVRVVATVVVVVFAVGIWATGDTLKSSWLRFYSIAVLVSTGMLWLWETLLWRMPPAQRIDGVPRNLNGTWKGTLTSFWVDPKTKKAIDPKPVYLVVRQTASTVSAILLTDESKSVSSHGVVTTGKGTASFDYLYLNRPDSRVQHRSRMHHGSTSLDIVGLPATRLKGRYWTDRDTKGELDFTERRKQKAEDYDGAANLF